MKIKIIKNNCNSWDLYRAEVGAEYFIQNCKTKKQAIVAKKLHIFADKNGELVDRLDLAEKKSGE
jgi:hypothetical protein